ncbi:MAG: chemotaxis protein CheA, partial [Halocynthiibacter sp.]
GVLVVKLDASAVPVFEELDWQDGYFEWKLGLTSNAPEDQVREAFDFVEGLCDLGIDILPAPSSEETTKPLPSVVPASPGIPNSPDNPKGAAIPQATNEAANDAANDPAAKKPAPHKQAARQTVRVDLERVDRLINAVGELVINQAVLSQAIENSQVAHIADIESGLDAFRHLLRDIQEGVMSIRAQPVKSVFQWMSRIVARLRRWPAKTSRLKPSVK